MSERFAAPPPEAWTELGRAEYDDAWARFEGRFGFRAGVAADAWPAIREPVPSLTFDLSVISDGAQRGAAYDAINAEALRAFVWALPDQDELLASIFHRAGACGLCAARWSRSRAIVV
jgi:hypothetical protein